MASLIFPSKFIPPSQLPVHQRHCEFPTKPNNISFNKPVITDTHLHKLCKTGRLQEAVDALDSFSQSGSKVRPDIFTRLIQSCTDTNSIHLGRKLHSKIHLLTDVDLFIETKLVCMYAKCGYLEDARKVFDEMRERNLFTWSAMICACSRERRWRQVLELCVLMMEGGFVPDKFLFPKIFQACGNLGDIQTGRIIHGMVVKRGVNFEIRVHNSILALYSKCGELDLVRRYFEKMEEKDGVSWNSIIRGYCLKGEIREARRLFELMQNEGVKPSLVTWNILISSYNQLGYCDVAMGMMTEMESFGVVPDVFTWTSMISGFGQNNRYTEALELFASMLLKGIEPNGITLASALSACASLKAARKGEEVHSIAVKIGFSDSLLVGNSLIDMYSKCAQLDAAQEVFDSTIEKDAYTFNSMIGGYCQAGYYGTAHDLFMRMQESDVQPNIITWNVMINGYIKNEDEDEALDLFHRMENDGNIKRDTATWNALIAGYLHNGHKNKALGIFRQMQSSFVRPNSVTILSILPAFANIISVKKVKEIHGSILRSKLEFELSVANSFIDTYSKSGNLMYAKAIFDGMPTKDIISWNTLMAASVLHGYPDAALDLFDHMREEGMIPNRGTFACVISACSIAKKVKDGEQAFSKMTQDYDIAPSLDHCTAMVDLYGRSGMLDKAIEFIENMSIQPDISIWNTFLTACRNHKNVRLGLHAGEQMVKLEPENAFIQRLLVQMHALCGNFDNSSKIKKPGIKNGTVECIGESWVEARNTVHTFSIGDRQQPAAVLLSWINDIAGKVKFPDCHDGLYFEEEEENKAGGVHSEKLALAFALIGSAQTSQTIRVLKSLRMCDDCHRMTKYVSKAYGRDIYVSHPKCLHHFKDGNCSCGDYW